MHSGDEENGEGLFEVRSLLLSKICQEPGSFTQSRHKEKGDEDKTSRVNT